MNLDEKLFNPESGKKPGRKEGKEEGKEKRKEERRGEKKERGIVNGTYCRMPLGAGWCFEALEGPL
jgi:hypothetical protein